MALIRRYTNIHTNKHKNKYRNNHLLLILGYRWSYKTPGCTDKLSYSASAWCVIEGTISKKCSNVRAGITLVDSTILKANQLPRNYKCYNPDHVWHEL